MDDQTAISELQKWIDVSETESVSDRMDRAVFTYARNAVETLAAVRSELESARTKQDISRLMVRLDELFAVKP